MGTKEKEGLVPVSKEMMDKLNRPMEEKKKSNDEFIESITHTKEIKELKERIVGYQKAMVDFEKKSYERAKIEVKAEIEKEIDNFQSNKKQVTDKILIQIELKDKLKQSLFQEKCQTKNQNQKKQY